MQQCNRLVVEGAAADEPVERVLQGAGDPEGVFGNREQDDLGAVGRAAQAHHGPGREGVQVGVERWEAAHRVVDLDDQAASRRRPGDGTKSGAVE